MGQKTYDFIVVGSGSAGGVLAHRLSESPSVSVLLIEAGPDFTTFDSLPDELKYSNTQYAFREGATYDWGYSATASERHSNMSVPRARVMGGCTSHNGPGPMFYRGVPEDFDNWANLGNTEWSFEKVLPYFIKLEKQDDIDSPFHGTNGPIKVRRHLKKDWLPFQEAGFQAFLDLGFPEHDDVNHPGYTGAAPRTHNEIDGVRQGTLLSYINPIRYRPNLTILSDTLVTRINFQGKRAIGVQAEKRGENLTFEAGEILISAGAVATPQLLMVSGVGPPEQLNENGIDVIHPLIGVGQNLRDHIQFPTITYEPRENLVLDPLAPRQQNQISYTATDSPLRNDIVITPVSFAVDLKKSGPMTPIGVGFSVILYLAKSSGTLRINSPDIRKSPIMDFKYLEDPFDLMRVREAVRICLELGAQAQVSKLIKARISPNDDVLSTDRSLNDWLLRTGSTSYHQAGTCKMGPNSDEFAVVDQFCRVHGLDGLRVVDASIMPDVVRANTNASTLMIGEKAADIIKSGIK